MTEIPTPRLSRSESPDPKGDILRSKIVRSGSGGWATRAEAVGFMIALAWVCDHFREAARRVEPDKHGTVERDGKSFEAVIASGQPFFAEKLDDLVAALAAEGAAACQILYPPYDPPPIKEKKRERDSGE